MSKNIRSRIENQGAPRLGFDAYSISRERYLELRNGCATGKYSPATLREACIGLEFIKPWILLSVTKNRSYDRIEYDLKLGRIPIGRTDFYGYRRLFYHNLDCLLRSKKENAAGKRKG